jgi:hypothetical protein
MNGPTAKSDDERTRQGETSDRQLDQHGVAPAKQADEDEPLAWPSADRQKMETTTARVEQSEPAQPREQPDVRSSPEMRREAQSRPAAEGQLDLPVPGYPISEEALTSWFCRTYRRAPSVRELGVLINAMAKRETTPPLAGPEPDPHGWQTGPSAPAATKP